MGNFSKLTEDQFAFTSFIDDIKTSLKIHHMASIPVYLTEWNLTISHRDLINDTCFKSRYLVKNLLQNYDRLDSFGYWCLSDFIEELQLPNELFHGGLGMFTYSGIPKAHYYAFRYLSHLRDFKIADGKGYYITRSDSDVMIVVYNYEHYSKLFANGIQFDVTQHDRYAPFLKRKKALFHVDITDIQTQECSIRELFINQQHGSSYDTWVNMGELSILDEVDSNLLKEKSLPGQIVRRQKVINNVLSLEAELEPLEVRLIHVRPIEG